MIELKIMKTKQLLIWFGLLFFTISCSTGIQFNTQKNAEPRFSGIRTVAINKVYLDQTQALQLSDNLGQWLVKDVKLKINNLETLVRKSLVVNLARFSDYQVIDLQDFVQFQSAFKKLRPLSGERLMNVDMIINIRMAYAAQQQTGKKQEVFTFRETTSSLQGEEWVKTRDHSYQKVVTIPYSFTQADLLCYVEVIDTRKGASRVLKSFNYTISNRKDPKTTMEEIVQESGVAISSEILKNVSKYSALTTRIIDESSDDEIVDLMKATKFEKAIQILETTISKSDEKNPADLYNLGICYEATENGGLALQMYQDAFAIDDDNELYIKAIGDLE